MKIWAYAVIWNEEKMLDFYLRHYSKFCDKIVFFDNESFGLIDFMIESPEITLWALTSVRPMNIPTHSMKR
mgnify:CR=1 FL=1